MAISNATVAIVQKAPPYVTYHVRGVFRAAGESTVDRTVVVRSDDGVSIVRDEDTGKDALRPAFPAPPTFDALAQFTLSGQIGMRGKSREGDMRITNIRPLHYETGPSHADVVARSVKGYVVTYAPDATPALGHIHLDRNASMTEQKWLRDVWYDPVTLIPTRILWGGRSDFMLDAEYHIVEGHWLLRAVQASGVVHAPLWLGRITVSIAGTYDRYAFSDAAPDPRLAPAPNGAAPP